MTRIAPKVGSVQKRMNMNHRREVSSLALLLLFSAGLVAQQARVPSAESEAQESKVKRVQLSQQARDSLAAAKELITSLKGVRGEERQAGLSKAAMAYSAVAEKFADEPAAACAALYEAGETWRRHGSLDKAEANYRQVLAKNGERYLGRATFQVAQMERRQKQFENAIATYQQAATFQPKQNRANQARLWIARCFVSLDKAEEAMQSFRNAVASAATPRQVIEASNYLAKALIEAGDLEAAKAALAKADQVAMPLIEAGGKDSEGLRAALDRMSARKALQKAQDKANGAGQDARQLDSDRRRKATAC